jgi:hypothetical protein
MMAIGAGLRFFAPDVPACRVYVRHYINLLVDRSTAINYTAAYGYTNIFSIKVSDGRQTQQMPGH